jgi:N-glycosylase/DNA lyase
MDKIYLPLPPNFSLKSTIFSHGWVDLAPFKHTIDPLQIDYVLKIPTSEVLKLELSSPNDLQLEIKTGHQVNDQAREHILTAVKRMFRLNEEYTEFYLLVRQSPEFSWITNFNAGRLLRCGTLWEDMVKMLCTTNCTWRLTQIMVENLVQKLGKPAGSKKENKSERAFPDPQNVAACDENFLRQEIKMGYRAPYLLKFSQAITEGKLNLPEFENENHSTPDLYKQLRSIKGFGDYAVSNLLKLLGRYDYLGADSWSRKKFAEKHLDGKLCDDSVIASYYQKFGRWSGLFFWMDVSEDWYQRELPFGKSQEPNPKSQINPNPE